MIQTHTIESPDLRVEVIPQLGGKVSSILDKRNGYEWLWGKDRGTLFTNGNGDPFGDSTMLGIDECIPTVAPCEVAGSPLADHGEAWSKPWEVLPQDPDAPERIALRVELCAGALVFSRSLQVEGDTVLLDYALQNPTDTPVPALWCIHPLFTLTPRTRLRIPRLAGRLGEVEVAVGMPLDDGQEVAFPDLSPGLSFDDASFPEGSCTKLFYPLDAQRGQTVEASMEEPGVGVLTMAFEASKWLNTLGIWLDRGGWQGYQHLAIEPTNAPYGRLSDAIADAPHDVVFLQPKEEKRWQLRLRVEAD